MVAVTTGEAATAAVPRALNLALLLAMVGPSLTFVTLSPSLPLIAAYFGGGASGQAVAQGAQGLSFLGGTAGGLIAGTVIARVGLARTLIGAALIYALAGTLGMSASVPAMLLVGCFGVGLMGALLSSALAKATGALLVGEPRSRMLGFQAATSDVSGIFVGLAAGLLAQAVGWRGPPAVYIGFGAMVAVLVGLSPPRDVDAPLGEESGGLIAVLRLAWPVYAACLLLSILLGTQTIQLPFHLAVHGVTNAGSRAVVQTCGITASAVASLSFGLLRSRLGEPRMLRLAGLSAAIGFIGYAVWHGGLPYICAAAAFVGLAIGICIPLLFTFALRVTPPHLHGYAIGLLNTAIFLGGAISPVIFAPVVAAGGFPLLFISCAVIAVFGTGTILVVLHRYGARDGGSSAPA